MLRKRITKLPNLVGRKSAAKEEPKEQPKEEPKEELKEELKEESKTGEIEPETRNLGEKESSSSNAQETVVTTESPVMLSLVSVEQTNDIKTNLEVERPPPPPSPSKFNRARIKAVPRFGQHPRKTSFSMPGSASESEEDGHRRTRNDSVCSTSSLSVEPQQQQPQQTQQEAPPSAPKKEAAPKKRSEQTRRFAEARREFQMKYKAGQLDKQKLTMFDLIFYNPTTNPMSEGGKKKAEPRDEEEDVDDPDKSAATPGENKENKEEDNEDEEDDGEPAPQIKVGANGEIVVDEQSLVIENRGTKRARAALQAAAVVDGDSRATYGCFRKARRAREWSRAETLRFYRALNTLGTDFSLMCELFPGRTRRDLKLKFKKEERNNRPLIDRAIMQPVRFNIEDLRRQVELEVKEAEARRESEIEKRARPKREAGKRSLPFKGIHQEVEDAEDHDLRTKKKPRQLKTPNEFLKGGTDSLLNSEDEEAGSDDEPLRKPKTISEICAENQRRNEAPSTEGEQTEPGSILISSTKDSSGSLVYKIYMVTPPEGPPAPPEVNTTISHGEDPLLLEYQLD